MQLATGGDKLNGLRGSRRLARLDSVLARDMHPFVIVAGDCRHAFGGTLMNMIDMTTGSAAQPRSFATTGTCTLFTATLSGTPHVVRGLAVWPIDEALALEAQILPAPADQAAEMPLDTALMHDLTASRLIAPPRLRRRRDRAVASRAALFQAAR